MNKKIISLLTAAALSAGMGTAFAADANNVDVVVNGAKISFNDQNAVIENDRTLIPARGAFEAMGCTVAWDGETRTVTVKNGRNTKIATLTIDSDKMNVVTYTSLFDSTTEEITLDVPAQIMNDRTMIPLRAVGEAMGATVAWDGETYTASITTSEGEKLEAKKEQLTSGSSTKNETKEDEVTEGEAVEDETAEAVAPEFVSLSLSEGEAEAENEVVVLLNLSGMNLYPEQCVSGVSLGLNYDSSVLELKSAELVNGDEVITNSLGAMNAEFKKSVLKASYVTIDSDAAAKADGAVMKVTFTVLSDAATEVSISEAYDTKRGYDTSVIFSNADSKTTKIQGTDLVIDSTPLTVND